ncbi:MAG: response regulator transcription factor [Acidobacteria bacterium]|nr:response regulator transcription factor [Acidobacteriota bacterium]
MKRILIVEDEPVIAAGLQDDLEAEGYSVQAVSDGDAGLQSARAGGWDLILLDVMLPGRDGLSVCRELRREGNGTPILMLTALSRENERITGLDVGADDYLTKPFASGELHARIRALLRRATPGVAGHGFGNCRFDAESARFYKQGKPVELTAREFKMLKVFLAEPGKILSIDDLLKKVWGPEMFLTDRVVYTHVNNLRAKIEDDPAHPRHIISLRGLGYRFDP